MTHCFVMILIVPSYFQIPPCMTKLWFWHEQTSFKPMHKVKERTVTLTYNLATWFLFATHHLIMMIICVNLFFKIPPRMTKLLAGHEQVSLKPMYKVLERPVTLTFNLATWFLFAIHRLITISICAKNIFKSHHA